MSRLIILISQLPQVGEDITGEADYGVNGLDVYEPQFFFPYDFWSKKQYQVKLRVTEELADKAIGGEIYYFCHIHSKMSGRIVIRNADGTPFTVKKNGKAVGLPVPL